MTTITTAAELDALPLGTVFTDRAGDVWMYDSMQAGYPVLISPETSRQAIWYILDHFGPLTLRWRPGQPPATVETAPVRIKIGLKTYQHGPYDLWYLVGDDGEVSTVGRPDYALIPAYIVSTPASAPERMCLARASTPHAPHDWWATSAGGGHELSPEAVGDPREPNQKQWRCPGVAPTATVKPSVRDLTECIATVLERDDDLVEAARAVLALFPGRSEAQVKAEALREYAAARYEAYLEQPETPWTEQPSDLAKRYAKAAEELLAEADLIERSDR